MTAHFVINHVNRLPWNRTLNISAVPASLSICFMIFLSLLCLSLSHPSTSHTLPYLIPPRGINSIDASILNPASNPDFFNSRSIYNIIWSCLATIFACTWIAIHPNLPAPKDGKGRVFARRLAIMGYLLLAPEMVIMWAARQYLAVLEISQRHHDRGWTRVHAFFLAMGGFMLYENGRPLRTLECREFEELLKQGKIDWPLISEEEIEDKSKGDYLSKGVALLQTSWFIAQCIVRGRYRLAVTELEVVTLAFATITMVIYSLWWYKPLEVGLPVPVHLKEGCTILDSASAEEPSQKSSSLSEKHPDHIDTVLQFELPFSSAAAHIFPPSPSTTPQSPLSTSKEAQRKSSHLECDQPDTFRSAKGGRPAEASSQSRINISSTASLHSDTQNPDSDLQTRGYLTRFRAYLQRQQQKHGVWRGTAYVLLIYPFIPFFGAFDDMMSCSTLDGKQFRVPTFYSPKAEDDSMSYLLALVIALTFGGIHCIAWNFHFPSLQERWIWRISAVLVSGLPMLIVVFSTFIDGGDHEYNSRWTEFLGNLDSWFCMLLTCIYMLSRLFLLILPFIGLRVLPPSAYVDISWTSFIPHI